MDMLNIFLWILVGLSFFYLYLVIKGPSIWDRLLGLNLIATKTIIIIVIVAAMRELSFIMDFAIMFALSGFIGSVFTCIFIAEYQRKMAKESGGRRKGDNKRAKGGK